MSCSIVLLTYNGEEFLENMLNSLKNQTYRPINLIIADDASSDNSVNIIKQFIKNNVDDLFHIKLVQQEKNLGRAGNRNSIIGKIRGEYVFLADQDDIWEAEKIQKQIQFLENNSDCYGVSCDRRLISETGKVLLESENAYLGNRHKMILDRKEGIVPKANYPANCIGFRNHNLEKVFSIPPEMETPDKFLRVMILCYGNLGYVKEPLVNYRIHAGNVSGNYFAQVNKNWIRIFKHYVNRNKRHNRIYAKDDRLLIDEVKNRFSIDLKENQSYQCRKKRNIYIRAAAQLGRDIMLRKVGEFL